MDFKMHVRKIYIFNCKIRPLSLSRFGTVLISSFKYTYNRGECSSGRSENRLKKRTKCKHFFRKQKKRRFPHFADSYSKSRLNELNPNENLVKNADSVQKWSVWRRKKKKKLSHFYLLPTDVETDLIEVADYWSKMPTLKIRREKYLLLPPPQLADGFPPGRYHFPSSGAKIEGKHFFV